MTAAIDVEALVERYDGFLIDAYGVLVHGEGPLPGAGDFLRRLTAAGRPWLIVTNDASKQPEVAEARYRAWDLPIPADRIVASGSLLTPWFRAAGLVGAPTCVIGPAGSAAWARQAGARLVDPSDPSWQVLALCDEASPGGFLADMDAALTVAIHRVDNGLPVRIVVPNPDLIYTAAPGRYGFAAGTMAAMVRAALELRFGDGAPQPEFLGKPHAPIFEQALARLDVARPVMLGDQLETDILGARSVGIDAVLVGSGVARWRPGRVGSTRAPTWLLAHV